MGLVRLFIGLKIQDDEASFWDLTFHIDLLWLHILQGWVPYPSDAVEQALSNNAKIIHFHFTLLRNDCNDSGCNAKVKSVSWVRLTATWPRHSQLSANLRPTTLPSFFVCLAQLNILISFSGWHEQVLNSNKILSEQVLISNKILSDSLSMTHLLATRQSRSLTQQEIEFVNAKWNECSR